MKGNSVVLLRSLLAAGVAAAALAAPFVAVQPQALALEPNEYQMYVWKVVHPDAMNDDKPDYIVGTIRVPPPAGKVMPKKVRNILSEATTLVTESANEQVNMSEYGKYFRMPTNRPLSAYLTKPAWQKLLGIGKQIGMGPDELNMMAPWAVLPFTVADLSQKMPPKHMDEILHDHALRAKVGLDFLESTEEQLRMMSEVSLRDQVLQLETALMSPVHFKKVNKTAEEAYFSGDMERVERDMLPDTERKRYPDYFKKMLDDRTSDWVQTVDELCQDEDAVIAVALPHLLGPNGLLKLLKERDYYVQAVPL